MLPRTRRLSPCWHHGRQRDELLPALPQAGEVSLPQPEQMLIHHRAHAKKRLLRLYDQLIHLISSSFLFHPAAIYGLFLCGGRKEQDSVGAKQGCRVQPSLLGTWAVPVCFWLILSPASMPTPEKCCFSLCELLQLLLLLCISETKLSPVLQHPFLQHPFHQTQTSLKLQKLKH